MSNLRFILCLSLVIVAACARPLTPNEVAFTRALQGEQVDISRVRLHDGHFAGSFTYQRPIRPRRTCSERIWPPSNGETVTVSPGATVIFHHILYREDLYRGDIMAGWPDRIELVDAMMFAHEMVHVWQWQNRKRTGYAPWKGLSEHSSADPYLFDPDETRAFLDYGYEQQGAIMEEYVCCHLLDPEAPRTARLRAMISEEMPIEGLEAALDAPDVYVPWSGVQTSGICRADQPPGPVSSQ